MQYNPPPQAVDNFHEEHLHSMRHSPAASRSSSEYWNYASSSLPYSSKSGSLPHQQVRSSSSGSIHGLEPHPYHRSADSYLWGADSYNVTCHFDPGVWPHTLPRWSDASVSWRNTTVPEEETTPVIHHHRYPVDSSFLDLSSPPSSSQSSATKSKSGAHNSGKICSHCNATSTPLWRRDPSTFRTLCNACGLYLQQRNKLRPQKLIDADVEESETSEIDRNGPQCSHCLTHDTSVWRRSKTGAQLCNACGVYARLRGKDRPLSLKRKKIKPRTKHAKPPV